MTAWSFTTLVLQDEITHLVNYYIMVVNTGKRGEAPLCIRFSVNTLDSRLNSRLILPLSFEGEGDIDSGELPAPYPLPLGKGKGGRACLAF